MKFVDEVQINIHSGKGGDGAVSFRREKFIPFGGPDGGNGGDGGSLIFEVNPQLNTLTHFRGKKTYKAKNGHQGEGSQRTGKNGDDLVLEVPLGTIIKDLETDEVLFDLSSECSITVLEGGRGGLGNTFFKTSTNQAPRKHTQGEEGQSLEIKLELKLLAEVGLVGLPNAGKSTLLSRISNARPKVADYPFTTLSPQLGVLKQHEKSVIVADIPGLIEDASNGKGLGLKFLKHIERTHTLLHLVDCSMCLEPFEAYEQYVTIRNELNNYSNILSEKREIVCLTKIDCMSKEEIDVFKDYFFKQLDKKVFSISSVSGENIDELANLLVQLNEVQHE